MVTSPVKLFFVASVDDLIHELAIASPIDHFKNVGTKPLDMHDLNGLARQYPLYPSVRRNLFEL